MTALEARDAAPLQGEKIWGILFFRGFFRIAKYAMLPGLKSRASTLKANSARLELHALQHLATLAVVLFSTSLSMCSHVAIAMRLRVERMYFLKATPQ